jgi:competence protein ComEA
MMSRQWMGAGLVLVAAAGAGAWYAGRSPDPPPLSVQRDAVAERGLITVHVAGAVLFPGLYEVPRAGRVADAIVAAGGARPDADLRAVNLAAPLSDGQQLAVPMLAEGGEVAADGRVRINVAGPEELERLPGVGPVLAERIAAHRQEHGPFTVVEDLLDVPGIGEGKLAALREAVLVP